MKEENLTEVPKQQPEPKTVYVGKKPDPEYNVDIIADYDGSIDIFYLNKKDPNYQYRFLRTTEENLSIKTGNLLFAMGGWQIVPKKHLLDKMGIDEKRLHPDGSYRKGDVVLAFMPKDLYKKKETFKKKKADAPMRQIERMLKEGDKDVGRGLHESMDKGLQTQKELGMK